MKEYICPVARNCSAHLIVERHFNCTCSEEDLSQGSSRCTSWHTRFVLRGCLAHNKHTFVGYVPFLPTSFDEGKRLIIDSIMDGLSGREILTRLRQEIPSCENFTLENMVQFVARLQKSYGVLLNREVEYAKMRREVGALALCLLWL